MDLDIKKVSAKATWEGHSLTGLELDASVAVLRDDLTGQIKQSLAELREEVISQLDELRGELTSGLDAEQEARDLDMAQMEDGIMRQISEASIAITFDDAPLRASLSFPDHPFW
ncbi:hypothetical protein M406DRAFT_320819 [Cryphonectria parasitica EP155]|uniref:Uncharacterized protein n=1 Tax=Cryphonectria parasitica (strain ATCC 38755 / EP155) TaxID=660469 RepID=A0A9P4Y8C3_CRYP1|nr:uncharacterized protein M406DRAFT_320819 [Cryphonectria parasitica EP155]KAF3768222.1 hypothetical protein M406DRAFT_320819 [Cryphonectria parasitica EP155]